MTHGWKRVALGSVAQIVNGGTPNTKVKDYWGGEHRWITPAEMGNLAAPYVSDTRRHLTGAGLKHSSATLVPPNSVILSTRAPIGHLVINAVPMAFNQGCRAVVPSTELDHKYLYYFLYASRDLLNNLGTGTTFKELAAGKLRNVDVPLASLAEQKRIVAILDETFAGIETAIANTEKNLANARELYQSYVSAVFSALSKDRRGLGDVSVNLDSQRIPITKAKREAGPIPYYGASGVVDHVAGHIFDEDLLLVSEDGANLLARTSPIAFSISGKSWVNNHAHVLQFENFASQRFIEYYLNSISLAAYVSGMAQPKLNQKALNSIPVPFPQIEEQREVVDKLDDLSKSADRLAKIYEQKLVSLTELKQALLHKAFSGELTTDEVDEAQKAVA